MRLIPLLWLVLLTAQPAAAQTAPFSCETAAAVQGLLTPNAFLYIESPQHNVDVDGVAIIERYQWRVYDEETGNPDSGPFVADVPITRLAFTPVAGVPNCYRTTPSPSGLPTNAGLRSVIIGVGRPGWGMAPRSEPSNSFLLPLLLQIRAVRVG